LGGAPDAEALGQIRGHGHVDAAEQLTDGTEVLLALLREAVERRFTDAKLDRECALRQDVPGDLFGSLRLVGVLQAPHHERPGRPR